MSTLPKVTKIPQLLEAIGCIRYRIEGGDIREDWAKNLRAGETPYCEVSVWHRGETLGSYGGSVWPSAWPDLFEAHKGSAQSGSFVVILPKGRTLLDAAI
jgi:hypothetical protein